MWYTLQKKILSVRVLVPAILMGCLAPLSCFAADSDAGIKEFKKPPVFNSREMGMENIEERIYKVMGIVDAVNQKAISIGDVQYNLAPGVRINCSEGAFVGLKFNDRGDVIKCEPVRPR